MINILGHRDFLKKEKIKEGITNSMIYSSSENIQDAKTLLLLETSKQKNWLVSTKKRLYCILDDIRKDKLNINWSMDKSKIISNGGQIILNLKIDENYSNEYGNVWFNDSKKGWFYSKKFYSSELFLKDEVVNLFK